MDINDLLSQYGIKMDIPDPLAEEDSLLNLHQEQDDNSPVLNDWAKFLGKSIAGATIAGPTAANWEDTNSAPPSPSFLDFNKGYSTDLLTAPLKAARGLMGAETQLLENEPYLAGPAALFTDPKDLRQMAGYLERSINSVDEWGKPASYQEKQNSPLITSNPNSALGFGLHDIGSVPEKFAGSLGDLAIMMAAPETAVPYLAAKSGGETYLDTYKNVLKETNDPELAKATANKAAAFGEASTLLAGKLGEAATGGLVGSSTSKLRGMVGGAVGTTAPFAAQAATQSVAQDVLEGKPIDAAKAVNAAAEQLPMAVFGAKGGLGEVKANQREIDLKNINERLQKELDSLRTGDPSFDEGIKAGAELNKFNSPNLNEAKQPDLFGYREPTIKDMFSGVEQEATGRGLGAPTANDLSTSSGTPQGGTDYEAFRVSPENRSNVDSARALVANSDLYLHPDNVNREARAKAEAPVQEQLASHDPEVQAAAQAHVDSNLPRIQGEVAQQRAAELTKAKGQIQQDETLSRMNKLAPEEQLGLKLPEGPTGEQYKLFSGDLPQGKTITQNGRTIDFIRGQEKLIGDSVIKELGIGSLAKGTAVPSRLNPKVRTSNPKSSAPVDLTSLRSKLDTSSVDQYDASKPVNSTNVHSSPESVKAELAKVGDSTSKTILGAIDSGKVEIRHSDEMPAKDKAFEQNLDGKVIRGGYNPHTDKVTLYYDRIGKGEVRGLMFHEIGEHAGHAELGSSFENLYRNVHDKSATDPLAKAAVDFGKSSADAAIQAHGDKPGLWLQTIKKESLARYMQLTEQAARGEKGLGKYSQIVRDIYSTAKVWMIRKGFAKPGGDLSAADIRAFARAAIDGWAKKGSEGTAGNTAYDYVPGRGKDERINSAGVKTQLGANLRLEAEQVANSAANKLPGLDKSNNTFKWQGSTAQALVRKAFRNSGFPSATARQLAEEHQGRRSLLIGDINASRNAWEDAAEKIPEELKQRALQEGPQVLKDYPKAQALLEKYRKMIGGMGALISDEVSKNPNLSEKDKTVATKILQNGENYLHSSHLLFAPDKGIRNKYVNTILSAYKADPNSPRGRIVKDALDFIVNKDLAFPDDLSVAKTTQLRRLYIAWLGRPSDQVKRSELISRLEEVQANIEKGNNNPNQRAWDLVQELLGRANQQDSNYRKIYIGSRLDRTTLTPLTALPEPMLALFGRVDKADSKLFDTLHAQAKILTQLRYLNNVRELGLKEGWIREDTKGSEGITTSKLTGESFGVLQDHWTTPAIKEHLDNYLETSKALNPVIQAVLNVWQPLARLAKTAATVGNVPGAYVANLVGAPLQMAINGNMRNGFFNEHSINGLKAVIGMIGISGKKEINPITREMIKHGLTDSAQIGELRDSEVKARLGDLLDLAGYSKGSVISKEVAGALKKVYEVGKDAYAAMDIWSKFANYYHQKAILTDLYAKEGRQVSKDEIERQAAERTKMTNFSYNRAAPWIKFTERNGLTMFGTYMYETWRTSINNMAMIHNDWKWADEFQNPEAKKVLQQHALLRAGGQLAVHTFQIGILTAAAGMLSQGRLGANPDKDNKIRDALPQASQDKLLIELGKTADGRSTAYFDVGRLDPTDPENSTLRHLVTGIGDPNKSFTDVGKKLGSDILSQAFPNSLFGYLITTEAKLKAGDHPKEPRFSITAPGLYEWVKENTSGMNPDTRSAMLGAVEKVIPNVATNLAAMATTMKHDPRDVWIASWQAMGMKPVIYNPALEIEKQAKSFSSGTKSDASFTLKQSVYPGMPQAELEKRFLEYKDTVNKGVDDLKKKIDGAEAWGLTKPEINKALREAHAGTKDIPRLTKDKAPLENFTPKTFDAMMQSKIDELPVGASKRETRVGYHKLASDLNKLAHRYKDYKTDEE